MEKTTTQELLAQAEKICAQRNVRLTPQRLEVLRLMSLQDGAISAYDLLDLLREAEPRCRQRFIARWSFCLNKVLCIRWNPPTVMCSVICSISPPILQPCLFAIAAAR